MHMLVALAAHKFLLDVMQNIMQYEQLRFPVFLEGFPPMDTCCFTFDSSSVIDANHSMPSGDTSR